MVDGRDDWGISRTRDQGVAVRLIVYPDARHGFDVPGLERPIEFLGHRLEYNKSAADRAADAVHDFLGEQIGEKAKAL
jgi:dienelactone hydrolase